MSHHYFAENATQRRRRKRQAGAPDRPPVSGEPPLHGHNNGGDWIECTDAHDRPPVSGEPPHEHRWVGPDAPPLLDTIPDHVVDRDGLVWRIVRDGGMATRADFTGITSIGIETLRSLHGPLHPVARLRAEQEGEGR
jgi:hypothetical protein